MRTTLLRKFGQDRGFALSILRRQLPPVSPSTALVILVAAKLVLSSPSTQFSLEIVRVQEEEEDGTRRWSTICSVLPFGSEKPSSASAAGAKEQHRDPMKKRTSEVTPVASVSIASSSSGTSVSPAPSVTFAADIADKESPARTSQAPPPTEVFRGTPRLARRRIDSISGSEKQRRLSRTTSAQDAVAWREFSPAGFGEDPQEHYVTVQRTVFPGNGKLKESTQTTQEPSHKAARGTSEKRSSKSTTPSDPNQVKASQAKKDVASTMPSITSQPEVGATFRRE
ncbi:hypothetical protein MRX96_043019 [Rhipicephalus microplus]